MPLVVPPLRVQSRGPEVYDMARDEDNFPDSPRIAPTWTSAHPAPLIQQSGLSDLFRESTDSDESLFHDLLTPPFSQNSSEFAISPVSSYNRGCDISTASREATYQNPGLNDTLQSPSIAGTSYKIIVCSNFCLNHLHPGLVM